jgi:opacity protein-like surface antigen
MNPARRDTIVPVSRVAVLAALLLVLPSTPARAGGFLTPFIGENFGGNSSNCAGLASGCSSKRKDYGASVGTTGTSTGKGVEIDLGYTKDFFGVGSGAETSVLSVMSNMIFVGGARIQPYVVAGAGLVRLQVSLNQTTVNSSAFGFDVGTGLNAFFMSHMGIRGDVRYLHTVQDVNVLLSSGKLGYWRASVGLAIKF